MSTPLGADPVLHLAVGHSPVCPSVGIKEGSWRRLGPAHDCVGSSWRWQNAEFGGDDDGHNLLDKKVPKLGQEAQHRHHAPTKRNERDAGGDHQDPDGYG